MRALWEAVNGSWKAALGTAEKLLLRFVGWAFSLEVEAWENTRTFFTQILSHHPSQICSSKCWSGNGNGNGSRGETLGVGGVEEGEAPRAGGTCLWLSSDNSPS